MRSLNRVGMVPASLPLSADDIVEFHAARLMLLMHVCGVSGRIDGLTKMAKLDFFARYPDFFEVARAAVTPTGMGASASEAIVSSDCPEAWPAWAKRRQDTRAPTR